MTIPTPVADELAAMRRIVAALDKLDPGAQLRVVVWLGERYDPAANHWAETEGVP